MMARGAPGVGGRGASVGDACDCFDAAFEAFDAPVAVVVPWPSDGTVASRDAGGWAPTMLSPGPGVELHVMNDVGTGDDGAASVVISADGAAGDCTRMGGIWLSRDSRWSIRCCSERKRALAAAAAAAAEAPVVATACLEDAV